MQGGIGRELVIAAGETRVLPIAILRIAGQGVFVLQAHIEEIKTKSESWPVWTTAPRSSGSKLQYVNSPRSLFMATCHRRTDAEPAKKPAPEPTRTNLPAESGKSESRKSGRSKPELAESELAESGLAESGFTHERRTDERQPEPGAKVRRRSLTRPAPRTRAEVSSGCRASLGYLELGG